MKLYWRSPTFWLGGKPSTVAVLMTKILAPLGWIYGRITTHRRRQPGLKLPVPVICCGNITLGGTGKTPTAIFVAHMLRTWGHTPGFLTRGWGGAIAGPHTVDPAMDTAAHVGDEALLLARCAPTVVSRDRALGAEKLCALGVSVIILDDGYQNPHLYKDASILIFDTTLGSGNGHVFPAGPLRESLSEGLDDASAILLIGPPNDALKATLSRHTTAPIVEGALVPHDLVSHSSFAQSPPLRWAAFSGIGHPQKFFATVIDLADTVGATVVATKAFPDHYPYTDQDTAALKKWAQQHEAQLITTEKDAVRLPAACHSHLVIVKVSLESTGLEEFLGRFKHSTHPQNP